MEEEIWRVVWDLSADKYPRPDGFTGSFFIAWLAIIKDDILDFFKAFSSLDCRGIEMVNLVYIFLLPKTQGTASMRDF